MKPQRLEIEGETFKDLREKFNYILNLALNRMHRMGINEGTVTAKVDIETEEVDEGDGTAAAFLQVRGGCAAAAERQDRRWRPERAENGKRPQKRRVYHRHGAIHFPGYAGGAEK